LVLDQLSSLISHEQPENAEALVVELSPYLTLLAETASVGDHPLLELVLGYRGSTGTFREFRRRRDAPLTTARLASTSQVIVGPDVRAAGLLPDGPSIEHDRSRQLRTVRIQLDGHLGHHLGRTQRLWPSTASTLEDVRWPNLWVHLVGLSAACPADRLGLGGAYTIASARRDIAAGLDGVVPHQPGSRPSAPVLYAGYANDPSVGATPFDAESDGDRVYLTAVVANRPGPIIVALAPGRTSGEGAVGNAVTFGHFAPKEASALLGAISGPRTAASCDIAKVASEFAAVANGSDAVSMDPGVAVLRILRSERERVADRVLRTVDRTTASRLAGSAAERYRLDEALAVLADLDELIPA